MIQPIVSDQLQQRGVRSTRPRRAVLEAAAGRDGRFTADEIVAELRPAGIGRATVFRTLDLLTELHILERVHADRHCGTYILCSPAHHHHLVCVGCSVVQEVTHPSVEEAVGAIAQEHGYRMQGHLLEIFGLCQRCQSGVGASPTRPLTAAEFARYRTERSAQLLPPQ